MLFLAAFALTAATPARAAAKAYYWYGHDVTITIDGDTMTVTPGKTNGAEDIGTSSFTFDVDMLWTSINSEDIGTATGNRVTGPVKNVVFRGRFNGTNLSSMFNTLDKNGKQLTDKRFENLATVDFTEAAFYNVTTDNMFNGCTTLETMKYSRANAETFDSLTTNALNASEVEQVVYANHNDGTNTSEKVTGKTGREKNKLYYTMPEATRTGYTLDSWNSESDGSGTAINGDTERGFTYSATSSRRRKFFTNNNSDGVVTKTKTQTFYAQWEGNTYTVKFDANGGEGSMDVQTAYYGDETTLPPNTFTREGYTFAGWNTKADGTGNKYADRADVKNLTSEENGEVTLYAQWQKNSYTVKFDANDGEGTMADESFDYNDEKALTTNTFTRTGYAFDGWSTTKDGIGGTKYTDGEAVKNLTTENNGSITLYAQWIAIRYTVKFDANNGEGTMDDESFYYNEEKKLTKNTFTRTGYTFDGWNTEANGSGTAYTDEQAVKNLTTIPKHEVTLYAQWKANEYTIKFDANSGEGTMDAQTLTYDDEKYLTKNAFTRTGYTFDGWNTAKDGKGTAYKDEAKIKNLAAKGDVTLYAQWQANEYTVKFDANTGKGSMDAQTLTYDKEEALTENAFTKKGYTFIGWNTQADGKGTTYTDKETVKNIAEKGDVTLYAQWAAKVYTVTFDANGGEGTTSKQLMSVDAATKLIENGFTREGYTFTGWNTKADGSGTSFEDQAEVKNLSEGEDVTLYAQWQKNEYTVIAGKPANGQVAVDPAKAAMGDKVTITATPDKGYELDAISAKDADGANVELTKNADGTYSFAMPASNVEISATFKQVKSDNNKGKKVPPAKSGNSTKPAKPAQTGKTAARSGRSAKTGDPTDAVLPIALISAAAMALAVTMGRKNRKSE